MRHLIPCSSGTQNASNAGAEHQYPCPLCPVSEAHYRPARTLTSPQRNSHPALVDRLIRDLTTELPVGYHVCLAHLDIYSNSMGHAATFPGVIPGTRQASRMGLKGPSKLEASPSRRDLRNRHRTRKGGERRSRKRFENNGQPPPRRTPPSSRWDVWCPPPPSLSEVLTRSVRHWT